MNTLYKALLAASALTAISAFPALADYSLMEDASLPSIIFVEFTGDAAEPKVIKAPSSANFVVDPALAPESERSNNSQGKKQAKLGGSTKKSKSLNERIEDTIADLENISDEDIEDEITKDIIEDKIFDGAALR